MHQRHPTVVREGDGDYRRLGVACFEEKVVQWWLVMSLESQFEAMFLLCSFGFRPEIRTIDACKRIRDILNDWSGAS